MGQPQHGPNVRYRQSKAGPNRERLPQQKQKHSLGNQVR